MDRLGTYRTSTSRVTGGRTGAPSTTTGSGTQTPATTGSPVSTTASTTLEGARANPPAGSNLGASTALTSAQADVAADATNETPPPSTRPPAETPASAQEREAREVLQWFDDQTRARVDPTFARHIQNSDEFRSQLERFGFSVHPREDGETGEASHTLQRSPLNPETESDSDFRMIREYNGQDSVGLPTQVRQFELNGRRYRITNAYERGTENLRRQTVTITNPDGARQIDKATFLHGNLHTIERTTTDRRSNTQSEQKFTYLEGRLYRVEQENPERRYDTSPDRLNIRFNDGRINEVDAKTDTLNTNYDVDHRGVATAGSRQIELDPDQGYAVSRSTETGRIYSPEGELQSRREQTSVRQSDGTFRTVNNIYDSEDNLTERETTVAGSEYHTGARVETLERFNEHGNVISNREREYGEDSRLAEETTTTFNNDGDVIGADCRRYGETGYQTLVEQRVTDANGNVIREYGIEERNGQNVSVLHTREFDGENLTAESSRIKDFSQNRDGNNLETTEVTYHPNGQEATREHREYTEGYHTDFSHRQRFDEQGNRVYEDIHDRETGYRRSFQLNDDGTTRDFHLTRPNPNEGEETLSVQRYGNGSIRAAGNGEMSLDEFRIAFQGQGGSEDFVRAMESENLSGVTVTTGENGVSTFSSTSGNRVYNFHVGNNYPRSTGFETQTTYGERVYSESKTYHSNGDRTERTSTTQDGRLTRLNEETRRRDGRTDTRTYNLLTSENTATDIRNRTNADGQRTYREYSRIDYNEGARRTNIDTNGDGRYDQNIVDNDLNTDGVYDTREQTFPRDQLRVHYEDRNADGRFSHNEVTDEYHYSDTSIRRDDMNEWTILDRDSYYDNIMNHLGAEETRLNQHVEQRRGPDGRPVTVSTFSSADNNRDHVSISYHYMGERADIVENPRALNDERPNMVTTRVERSDGAVIQTTAVPGAPDNYSVDIQDRRGEWNRHRIHTHMMDSRNEEQTNMLVTEMTSDSASMRDFQSQLNRMGIRDLPPSFDDFRHAVGSENMTVRIQENRNHRTGEVTRSITAVNQETGHRFVMNDEADEVVASFRNGETGEEVTDLGDLSIRTMGENAAISQRSPDGSYEVVDQLTTSELMGSTRTGLKTARAGLGATNFLAGVRRASRTTRAGSMATGNTMADHLADRLRSRGIDCSILRHTDKFNTALGGLTLTSTLVDLLSRDNVRVQDVSRMVGDVADLGYDVSKLNVLRGALLRTAGGNAARTATMTSRLAITGKVLGAVGVGASLVSAGFNIAEGDYFAAGLDGLTAVGSTIGLIAGSTSWAGPVGWGIAAVGIAGSIIYSNVKADEIHTLGSSPLEREFGMMRHIRPR